MHRSILIMIRLMTGCRELIHVHSDAWRYQSIDHHLSAIIRLCRMSVQTSIVHFIVRIASKCNPALANVS